MGEESDRQLEPQKISSNELVAPWPLAGSTTDIVSTGIIRLSILYDNAPSPAIDAVWAEALADIGPAKLVELFRKLENTFMPTSACPFPTPAHIRALLEEEHTLERIKDAELAWDVLLHVLNKHYHPNVEGGWKRGSPKLSPRTSVAANAAGGIPFIWSCTNAQLVWVKKDFIAAYGRETA